VVFAPDLLWQSAVSVRVPGLCLRPRTVRSVAQGKTKTPQKVGETVLAIPVTPELRVIRDWSAKRVTEAVEEMARLDKTLDLASTHVDKVKAWLVSAMFLNHAARLCIAQLSVPPLIPPTLDDLRQTLDWLEREL
jgi:hypothetical protein